MLVAVPTGPLEKHLTLHTHPIVVLYRWRLHPGKEESFTQAWSRVTELLRAQRGSLGSRLHRGPDGIWYGYAQWPSVEVRNAAFSAPAVDEHATEQMRDAVAERFPDLVLEPIADFLVPFTDPKA